MPEIAAGMRDDVLVPGRVQYFYRDPAAPVANDGYHVGVVALLEHDGRVLVERRSDVAQWGFIGGAIQDDESLVAAVRREVREETAIDVAEFSLFGTFSDPSRLIAYPDGRVSRSISIAFTAPLSPDARPTASLESLELRLVPPSELRELDFVPTHRPIRDRYLEGNRPVAD